MPVGYQQRRPPITRPVQRIGQQQQGPFTSTLPQRMGQTQAGPYTTNVGRPYSSTEGPLMQPPYSHPGVAWNAYSPGGQYGKSATRMPMLQQGIPDGVNMRPRSIGASGPIPLAPQPMSNPGGFVPQDPVNAYNLSGPNGTPLIRPGGDHVIYRDGQYAPTAQFGAQVDTAVRRDREYDAAAGSGPYDSPSAAARFNRLGSTPQQQQSPLMVRPTAAGPLDTFEEVQAHNAAGGNMAWRGAPGAGNALNQAYAARADQKQQMLQAGRNVRANRQYGTPLRPDLFPRASAAYAQQGGGQANQPSQSVLGAVSRNTITGEDGATSTDWGRAAMSVFDDPAFKNNPQGAFDELRKHGFTSDDLDELISSRSGLFGIRFGENEPFIGWLEGMRGQGGTAPSGLFGTPQQPVSPDPSAAPQPTWNPNNPVNTLLPKLPSYGFDPTNPFNPFPIGQGPVRQQPTMPPPVSVQRRPGPAYRPNF